MQSERAIENINKMEREGWAVRLFIYNPGVSTTAIVVFERED